MEFKPKNVLEKMTSRELYQYILESLEHCVAPELLEIAEKCNEVLEEEYSIFGVE